MKAYQGIITKSEFVAELKAHQAHDDFIRGTYWNAEQRKGCAVGCSIESVSRLKGLGLTKFSNHGHYPALLGIPEWLARVEDSIFEHIPVERSKTWPVEFADAINEGAPLEKIQTPFLIMLLEHSLASMDACKFDGEAFPAVRAAVDGSRSAVLQMIAAKRNGDAAEAAVAAVAAWAAWVAEAAAGAAEAEAFEYYADRLLELLRECK
jgi:hypothetical protein